MEERMHRASRRILTLLALGALSVAGLATAACSRNQAEAGPAGPVLHVGAIPDQDPQELQRIYGGLADYLATNLSVRVVYVPVTEYAAAVSAFRRGDLELVFFG